jgi:hypothetical protein
LPPGTKEPAAPELLLALSPLLAPLRFLSRAGLSRLNTLRELEGLVERTLLAAQASAGAQGKALQELAQSFRGFDAAPEPQRRATLLRLVRELATISPLPPDIAALTQAEPEPPARPAAATPAVARAPAVSRPPPARKSSPARAKEDEAAPAGDPLATPVEKLRGVGPATAEHLRAKQLGTVGDLLLNLPRRYEDRRTPRAVAEAPLGERSLIVGTVTRAGEQRGRTRRFEMLVRDAAGDTLVCLWFHFRFSLARKFAPGARVLVSGEVKPGYRGGGKTMTHPDVELLSPTAGQQELGEAAALSQLSGAQGIEDSFGAVVPVYTEIEGVPARTYRRIAHHGVEEYLRFVEDRLPPELLSRRRLLSLQEALRESHFPKAFADDAARGRPGGEPHRRLAFEELFLVQLGPRSNGAASRWSRASPSAPTRRPWRNSSRGCPGRSPARRKKRCRPSPPTCAATSR